MHIIPAMYSGITQDLLPVSYVEKKLGVINYRLTFTDTLLQNLTIGASVSIDGVCQTVTAIQSNEISFTAIAETLRVTTLGELFQGRTVSVERSLRYGDEIGGHQLAGHVIGTGSVTQIIPQPNNLTLGILCPSEWMKYIVHKGFIAVDGSSLTADTRTNQSASGNGLFHVHLIPETLRLTNFTNKKIGDRVNIELDQTVQLIVSTVERLMARL